MSGDVLAWTEGADQGTFRLWAINLRDGAPARQLTADTGNAVFYGWQYDLVIADGRVHWAAAASNDAEATEIRSVALTGGAVDVHTEAGTWALSAWPWLVNGISDITGTSRLRNMSTNRDVPVPVNGAQTTTCSPTWCRVVAATSDTAGGIELLHPNGTGRQRIAGGAAAPALVDVAVLDRFEVLSEPGPNSELTGTAGLLIYDIATKRTIDIDPSVGNAAFGNGVLWWSTGNQDTIIWHSIDLRTV